MSDFTADTAVPTHINTWMDLISGLTARNQLSIGTPSSTTWGTANLALYIPMLLPWPYLVRRAFWGNGTALGNCDIGIYSEGGARLWSAGSTAQSGASALQYVTVTGGLLLVPGRYYLAYSNDGTLNRVLGASGVATRLCGFLQQGSALPLPATATFAAQSSNVAFPLAGITNSPSGF